jgi:flagellar hook-associated protein 3 FlgL
VNGKRLFGDASTGIVPALNDLVTSLRTKNTSGIERAMGALDDHISNVISVRADLGARTNRMISLSEQLESTIINLQSNLGDLRDLDMAKAITDLTNQQNVYQASLAVGAKIIQPSLIDFLR